MEETESVRRAPIRLGKADLTAGVIFILFGVAGYAFTSDLGMGTAAMLGSGFMPRTVSVLLTLFGLAIALRSLKGDGEVIEVTSFRPLIVVTLCVVAFALTLERLGLVAATGITVALSAFAGAGARIIPLIILGVGLAAACVAIFIWGAKLPINAWPI